MRKINNSFTRQFILLGILLILIIVPNTVDAFSDVNQNDWFYDNVIGLKTRGVISGYEDNTFKPGDNISHGESLKLIVMLNKSQVASKQEGEHWAESYVQAAINDKILFLDKNGLDYNKEATRLETATYILNYINTALNSKVAPGEINIGSSVDSYFEDAHGHGLNFLYENGIITGSPADYGKNKFLGQRNITRAEYAAIMDRAENFVLANVSQAENPYGMIKDIRTINYSSIDQYTHDTFDIEDYIMAIYYMKYHNLESIKFTYSPEHYSHIIKNNQISKEYIGVIEKAYTYVSGSYPELFFTENRMNLAVDVAKNKAITLTYTLDSPVFTREASVFRRITFEEETIKEAKKLIDNGKIKGDMTECEIAKVLHDWVLDRVEYDRHLTNTSFDGFSALIDQKAVCTGYSALLHRMMSLFGLDIIGTVGRVDGVLHIWGETILDGEKYYIDPTWNDTSDNPQYFTKDLNLFSQYRDISWDKNLFDGNRHLIH